MVEMLKVIGVGLALVVTVTILKQTKPELVPIVLMAGCVILSLFIVNNTH